jgi:hypothetical protein
VWSGVSQFRPGKVRLSARLRRVALVVAVYLVESQFFRERIRVGLVGVTARAFPDVFPFSDVAFLYSTVSWMATLLIGTKNTFCLTNKCFSLQF